MGRCRRRFDGNGRPSVPVARRRRIKQLGASDCQDRRRGPPRVMVTADPRRRLASHELLAALQGPANDVCSMRQRRRSRFCTAPEKAGIQRRVRIQDAQLTAAKVSNPRFRGKVRKFPRHFKGHFSIGNVQVRILRGQPGSLEAGESTPQRRERPAFGGLLQFGAGL
jgi:hypothetical protein